MTAKNKKLLAHGWWTQREAETKYLARCYECDIVYGLTKCITPQDPALCCVGCDTIIKPIQEE